MILLEHTLWMMRDCLLLSRAAHDGAFLKSRNAMFSMTYSIATMLFDLDASFLYIKDSRVQLPCRLK